VWAEYKGFKIERSESVKITLPYWRGEVLSVDDNRPHGSKF